MIRRCSWRLFLNEERDTHSFRSSGEESRTFVEISVADFSIDRGGSVDRYERKGEREEKAIWKERRGKKAIEHTHLLHLWFAREKKDI